MILLSERCVATKGMSRIQFPADTQFAPHHAVSIWFCGQPSSYPAGTRDLVPVAGA
jgi:hypothetical protein